MSVARRAASRRMVVFCRRRNASAPSLMALEISRIAGVPVSRFKTQEIRYPATKSEPTEKTRTRGRARSGDIPTPLYSTSGNRRPRPAGTGVAAVRGGQGYQDLWELISKRSDPVD